MMGITDVNLLNFMIYDVIFTLAKFFIGLMHVNYRIQLKCIQRQTLFTDATSVIPGGYWGPQVTSVMPRWFDVMMTFKKNLWHSSDDDIKKTFYHPEKHWEKKKQMWFIITCRTNFGLHTYIFLPPSEYIPLLKPWCVSAAPLLTG